MSKRIIIIFVCLLLVIVPVVLLAGVFVVHDIYVINKGEDFEYDKQGIVDDSLIGYNSSIFVLSEKNATHNIELKNPTIKVINIERIFPNKVEIYITERIPVFAIKMKNVDKYALVDRELKVIGITDYKDYDISEAIFYGEDLDITEYDFANKIQTIPTDELNGYIMQGIIEGFELVNFSNTRFTSLVKSFSTDNKYIDIVMESGATMQVPIKSSDESVTIADMVAGAFARYKIDLDASLIDDEKGAIGKENILHGRYYFNTTDGGWDVENKDTH